jgi:hypothetical protein
MPDTDPPIIINGGSVSIEFDEQTYPGSNGRYGNERRKIVNVEVTDDNTGQIQTVPVPTDGKCSVRIYTN